MNPGFVYLATDVQSENLALLLLLLSALQLLSAVDGHRMRDALGAGVFLAFAVLTRPSCLALSPFLVAAFLARARRAHLRQSAAAVGGTVMALAPWTIRNGMRFGSFLPVGDQFGIVFWIGNTQLNVDYYRVTTREDYEEFLRSYMNEAASGRIRDIGLAYTNAAERSRAIVADAVSWIRKNPGAWLRLMGDKSLDWLRPWASRHTWSRAVVGATGLWYGALFALAGLGLARGGNRWASAAATGVLVLSAAAHIVTAVLWRYRMVFWDPVLIPFAVLGARFLYRSAGSRATSRRQAPDS